MNQKSHRQVLFVAQAGIIAALYVVLTWLSALVGLSGQNAIQIRVSEALCILPYFTTAAVPGLTVGCLLANLLTGAAPLDVVFGTLATLLGALGALLLRKRRFLTPWPNVLSNTLIVPFVVYYVYYNAQDITLPYLFLTVFIGEVIAGGVLGTLLLLALDRRGLGGMLEKRRSLRGRASGTTRATDAEQPVGKTETESSADEKPLDKPPAKG